MRLTNKNRETNRWTQPGDDYLSARNIKHKQCVNKLGQLEDLEEDLGIDLITLFKALKNGAWFKNPYYKNEINYIDNLESKFDFLKKRFDIRMGYFVKFYDYRTGGAFFLFEDYGKTRALTKEELI